MAERRMFAKTIVLSDAFLDMPLSARCLYFTLGMFADDDGFVNSPKGIMRQCGASEDDLRVLIAKKFLLVFESGVIVIKHWRINNYLRNDRYLPTKYRDEKELLTIEENGAYTMTENDGIPNVGIPNSGIPSIGKDRIGNNKLLSNDNSSSIEIDEHTPYQWLIDAWNTLESYGIKPIKRFVDGSTRYTQMRTRVKQYGKEAILEAIENIKYSDFLQGKTGKKAWVITFDWFIKPSNFPKVLEGNYGMKPKAAVPVAESPKEEEFDLEKWEKENGFV